MRTTSVMRRGSWLALLAGATLLALAGWLAVGRPAQANPATVSIGSVTVVPNGSATIGITLTPGTGETVGALTLDVAYSGAVVTPTACAAPGGVCNTAYAPATVRFALASPGGLTGQVGTITFTAGPSQG